MSYKIDLYIYFTILLSVSIIGIVNFKKLTIPFKLLALFLIYTFISEIMARVFGAMIQNASPVYHAFVLANYYFYSGIFYHLHKGPVMRKIILWSAIPFTCFWLINLIFFQHVLEFPTYSLMVSSILYVIYSLALFLQMLEMPTEVAIFKQNVFWFNISALFYTVATVASFSIAGYMVKHHIDNRPVGKIFDIVTDINYAMLGYTVFADRKRKGKAATPSS